MTERIERTIIPASIFALALFIRLWHLGKQSIWMDEGFSVWVSSHSVHTIFTLLKMDTHPPAFYLFLHEWFALVGFNDFWLRFPFAVMDAGSAVLIYWVVRECSGRNTALLSSLFWAASFYVQYIDTQVRMYPMALLLSLLSTLFFLKAFRQPTIWRWLVYLVFAILALYTHYYCGFIVFAQLFYLVLRKRILEAGLLFIGLAFLFSPWIPKFFYQVHHFVDWRGSKLQPLWTLDFFATLLGTSLLKENKFFMGLANGLGMVILLAGGLVIFRRKSKEQELLLLLLVLPLSLLAVCYYFEISFVDWSRHIIFLAPYFYFLLAALLISLPRLLLIPLLVCFFSINLFSSYLFGTGPAFDRQNWRAVSNYLKPWLQPGDTVWVEQLLSVFPLWYYSPESVDISLKTKSDKVFIQIVPRKNRFFGIGSTGVQNDELKRMNLNSKKIWLILCQGEIDDPGEKVFRWLKNHCALLLSQRYRCLDGDIQIFLFKSPQEP